MVIVLYFYSHFLIKDYLMRVIMGILQVFRNGWETQPKSRSKRYTTYYLHEFI